MADMQVYGGETPLEALARKMEEARQAAHAKEGGAGYLCSYISGLHPQSPKAQEHGAGTLEVSISAEEKLYGTVAAVKEVDVIGMITPFKTSNPSPRRWEVSFNAPEEMQEEFGNSFCGSTDGLSPDPAYHGRTFEHPSADGRSNVIVSAGWNSDKVRTIETAFTVTDETMCNECPVGQAWFTVNGELSLQQSCKAQYGVVVNLVGLLGTGILEPAQRGLTMITMAKQAARCVFSRQKKRNGDPNPDTVFQGQVGIPAPMANYDKAKGIDGLPPDTVLVPVGDKLYKRYMFPLLLGAIQHQNVTSKGKQSGISIIPFLFNPADSVRRVLNENDHETPGLMQKAIIQAANDFAVYVKPADITKFLQDVISLLGETTVVDGTPTEGLYVEHYDIFSKYHLEGEDGRKEGRVRLTTPFTPEGTVQTTGEKTTGGTIAPNTEPIVGGVKSEVVTVETVREPVAPPPEVEALESLPEFAIPSMFGDDAQWQE